MSTTQEVRDGDTSLEVEEEADHGHHWLIESPNGPTSVGTCKVCGLIREFKNSIQITSCLFNKSKSTPFGVLLLLLQITLINSG